MNTSKTEKIREWKKQFLNGFLEINYSEVRDCKGLESLQVPTSRYTLSYKGKVVQANSFKELLMGIVKLGRSRK